MGRRYGDDLRERGLVEAERTSARAAGPLPATGATSIAAGSRPSGSGLSNPDPSRFPCPGCGAVIPYASARYPRRFCPSCLDTAVDAEGRSLEFADASMSGGLWWRRRGEASWHEETHDMVLCTVRGVPARVQEARLGGIATEPIPADFAPPAVDGFGGLVRVADLRGPGRGAAVALR